MTSPRRTRQPGTAVVIGAGVAGLSAAAALAERFADVVVLDRDALPDGPWPRRGVPQGHHGHVLLASGQRTIEGLFPGIMDELVAAGAQRFDPGEDLAFYRFGARWPRVSVGLELVSVSRSLLETRMRRHLAAGPRVRVRDRVAVAGLAANDGQVTGVRLDDGSVVDAALVVDCSGRGGRSDRWLTALGYRPPSVVEVKVGVGYASRMLRRGPADVDLRVGAFVLPAPPHERRAGVALAVEDDRWLLSMGGWHGDYPVDEPTFEAHARSLPDPTFARLLDTCEPLGDVHVYGFPSNRRRMFEELAPVPAGYVATGDAVCSFNPIYGQGMTCAALEAAALGELLDRHGRIDAELSRAFFAAAGRVIATPWRFACGGDFSYPQTEGPRPRGIGLLNRYSRRIQLAAQVDPDVRRAFVTVQHLLAPPTILNRPAMVWKVVRASRRAPGARG